MLETASNPGKISSRPMLGISPSDWEEANEVLGPPDAAVVLAAILQRSSLINSAGGYLRNLTEKARGGGLLPSADAHGLDSRQSAEWLSKNASVISWSRPGSGSIDIIVSRTMAEVQKRVQVIPRHSLPPRGIRPCRISRKRERRFGKSGPWQIGPTARFVKNRTPRGSQAPRRASTLQLDEDGRAWSRRDDLFSPDRRLRRNQRRSHHVAPMAEA
jgi:replication protein C-like